LVEYAPDFQLADDGAMYIYFRPLRLDSVSFETQFVEYSLVQAGASLMGIDPNQIGQQVVKSQLDRGFTVIRYDDEGNMDFGLGLVPRGGQPFKPFRLASEDKVELANDRTALHSGQQDYIGGFEVTEENQALYMVLSLEGAPAVDVLVLPKSVGDVMIQQYIKSAGPAFPTAPAAMDDVLVSGQLWKRFVKVPPGQYYVVIDHSAGPGRSAPTSANGQDQPARVDYGIQRSEAP
jgi:hypothetical protein